MDEKEKMKAYYEGQALRTGTLFDDWHKRWVFSLGVGNGVSLVTVAGTIFEKYDARLMPSAWLFLIGLIAAGTLPFVLSRRHAAAWDFYRSKADELDGKFTISEGEIDYASEDYIDLKRASLKNYGRLETTFLTISSASFILAMILGLASLSAG